MVEKGVVPWGKTLINIRLARNIIDEALILCVFRVFFLFVQFVLQNTTIVNGTNTLTPEIQLRLITPQCEIWNATENDLQLLRLNHGVDVCIALSISRSHDNNKIRFVIPCIRDTIHFFHRHHFGGFGGRYVSRCQITFYEGVTPLLTSWNAF